MKVFQIADFLGEIFNQAGDAEINGAASLQTAQIGDISFIEKAENEIKTRASCLLVPKIFDAEILHDKSIAVIRVENPKLAFAKVAAEIFPPKKRENGVHNSAIVSESAKLGVNLSVGAFVCIGENSEIGDETEILAGAKIGDHVKIGKRCTIYPNVFVEDNVFIGDDVIIHAGAVIGADGFGYVRDGAKGYVKFPQIGKVVIENSVEIGANTCIDRGSLGETRIGEGAKIDNLVQIAHNVQIGRRVIIAAQTGISGSTIIEDDCVIGGQVGMGDHAKVLSGAIIGSQAGVLPGKIVRAGVWWGTPVQPLEEYKRQNAMIKSLGRLREQVKDILKRLEAEK